jgi:hypothetical protein
MPTRRELLSGIGAATVAGLCSNPQSLFSQTTVPNQAEETFAASKSIVSAPRSKVFKGIEWLSDVVSYPEIDKRGDTFPVTWSDDDDIYTSAGDPVWPDKGSGLDVERLIGNAPNFQLERVNPMRDYSGSGGCGPKPTGFLSARGKLYLAFQNMTGRSDLPHNESDIMAIYGHGYDAQIVESNDHGKTWVPDLKTIKKPMFPGRIFGAVAFINFGKDNAGARDKFVYAVSGQGWDNGSELRLGRVPATEIMNVESWQWVSGAGSDGQPVWSNAMAHSVPVLTHPGYLGCVEMVYLRGASRYLLISWRHKVKCNPDTGSELIIYDSPEPWGPFTLVHHQDPWETTELNPYNPRLPLKWFDQEKLEGWMLFSGSWRKEGKTPNYRMHVKRFRLLRNA